MALEENEVVVGVHRTISGYSNTGFEIIISSPANTSQKRLLAVDNDGTPLELEANSTIGSDELRFQLLELTTGIDLNSDNINGFTINKSDVINQGLQNDLNRRISLSTNDTILLSKEILPIGDLTGSNLNSSLLRYDNWNGPGVIVLADSNGVSPFKTEANQTLLGARIVRNEEHAPLSPPKVERAELFVSKNNTTEVIKFSLDGTNNGIATYAGSDVLSTDQINLIRLETGFDLSGDNSDRITVKSVLYNPSTTGSAAREQDRYVSETLSGEIVLSRENATVGTVVRETINNQKPIILSDNNGKPINLTTLNSSSSSKVLGARTIVFQPKGWQSEISNDATSPIGYNLYVESSSDENSVDVLSFGADGRQVSLSTLNLGELLSAEVSENLDLNNDDLIGGVIQNSLFTPQGGGSDRRFVVQTTQGILVSRDQLSEGTDLKTRFPISDRNSGPAQLRLTTTSGAAFAPNTNESIVGAHSTYAADDEMHLRPAGVVLYLKDSADDSVRAATFDLNGEFVEAEEISGNALVNAEIRSSGDFDNDSFIGAEIRSLLFTPTTIHGGNPERYIYDTDKGIIITRDILAPHGEDSKLTINSSSFNINGYDGPSIIAVDNSVSVSDDEEITAARISRSPVTSGSYISLADGFEIYISNNNSNAVRVVKLNLDGSLASTHSRSIDKSIGITITPINDNPIQSGHYPKSRRTRR